MGYFLPGIAIRQRSRHGCGAQAARSLDEIKAMLDKAGYAGERIVLHASRPTSSSTTRCRTVVVDAFRKVGINIDEQMMDWGTVVQRRTSKEPLDKGGWSMFPGGAPGGRLSSIRCWRASSAATAPRPGSAGQKIRKWRPRTTPGSTPPAMRNGGGWSSDYQAAAFNSVPIIPLGQYLPQAAWRSNVTGLLKGSAPVFWGAEKG